MIQTENSGAPPVSGARFILETLGEQGITHFFMVPGKLINPLMSCFPANGPHPEGIRPVVTACETGASYMAEGYARASEKFGVCAVIGGPGATNALTGIASAFSDGFPVLLLVGQIASEYELMNALQDSTQTGVCIQDVFKPVTRLALELKKGQSVPRFLRDCLRTLDGIEPGPVYLGVSREALVDPVTDAAGPIRKPDSQRCSGRAVAIDRFRNPGIAGFPSNAKRFAILAGLRAKSLDVQEVLVEFSRKYQVPVATTLSAKGLFPEDDPLSLGVFGYSGNPRATDTLCSSELEGLILLGVDTTQWSTMVWNPALKPRCGSIQVDRNPEYLGKYLDVSECVQADPTQFLLYFGETLDTQLRSGIAVRKDWVAECIRLPKYVPIDTSGAFHPASAVGVLRRYFPREGIVAVDSGTHRSFFGHYWEAYDPRAYLSATTIGPMGWSIPAGIGASFARPDLPCMVVTGDGSMLMQGLELATAHKYQRNVLFVVFNNASYAASYFNNKHNLAELTDIPDYDWVSFARTFSIPGVRVSNLMELADQMPAIVNRSTPFLLEIRCGSTFPTPNAHFSARMKLYPGL